MKKLITFMVVSIFIIFILCTTMVAFENKKSLKTFNINSDDIVFYEKLKEEPKIRVYISEKNKVEEMKIEEYVVGVVCAEMPAEFEIEALKAQSIAARTFALAHIEELGGCKCDKSKNADICDSTHCQVYMPKNIRLNSWPEKSRDKYFKKITQAVMETKGQVITYDGKLVTEPYYFAISSGRTENSEDMFSTYKPYLTSVASPGEEIASKYQTSVKLSYGEFNKKINRKYSNINISNKNAKEKVKIISRSEGGSIKELKVDNITMSGLEFRNIMGLNSPNFKINFNDKNIEVICKGYGHGVGMSQWGANAMSKSGKKYNEILTHYYKGVKIDTLW